MSSTSSASSTVNEHKLSRIIRHIYDGANFNKEIASKRERRKALEAIQKSIPAPPSVLSTTDSHEKIAKAITQIDEDERKLRDKLHVCESVLKGHFSGCVEEISQKMMRDGDAKVESSLRKRLEAVDVHFKNINEKMAKDMESIRASKLGVEEGNQKITEMIRTSREQLIQRTEEQIESLRSQNRQAFVELRDQYLELSSASYKEQLRLSLIKDVAEKVSEQLKVDGLEPFKQQVVELVEKSQKAPDVSSLESRCTELIEKEIKRHISKDELLKQLDGLEKWKEMSSKLEELESKIGRGKHAPEINAIQHLRNDIGQMNRKIDAIQKHLDKATDKDTEAEQLATVSRSIQDIARDLAVTNSQLEMAETWYTFNDGELNRQKKQRASEGAQDGARAKKRPRTEEQAVEDKLKTLEEKQSSLTEYVNGFRSTVLNPQFPERLQKAMTDIELVLRSHEEFIAHLVDPVRAAQRAPVDLTGDSRQPSQTLSPAMIQAIQALVKNTAEQTAKPLLDRIAALEAKLAKHQ